MPKRMTTITLLIGLASWCQVSGQAQQIPVGGLYNQGYVGVQQVSASVEIPVGFNSAGIVDVANPVFAEQAEVQASESFKGGKEDVPANQTAPGSQNASAGQDGLRPKPSADVLESLMTPSTAYEGAVPESAAAKRAVPPIYLGFDRGWATHMYLWQSANICHHPLYFEDAMLERHGHTRLPCLQPVVSGSKFLGELALMPYLMTLHRPCECRYALGHFRPGTCAPALKDTLPWDRHAAIVQSLAVTGVVVGFPW